MLAGAKVKSTDSIADSIYVGLDRSTQSCAFQLIESSNRALASLGQGKTIGRALTGLVDTIDQLLTNDGLAGWIACRCGITLMQYSTPLNYFFVGSNRYVSRADAPLRRIGSWTNLRRKLTGFYQTSIPQATDSAGRTLAGRIIQMGLHRTCPSHVQINGELKSVAVMLANSYINSTDLPLEWLSHTPIPHYWITEIITTDPSLSVLGMLARHKLDWHGPKPRLDREIIRKITSAIRKSDDKALITGALFALIGSKFWNVVRAGTLQRILEIDASGSDIASALFDSRGNLQGQVPPQRAVRLAERVIRQKIKVSRSTGAAAARFLLDNSSANFAPLRSLQFFPKS
jgi:hypothetical protein